MKVPWTIIHINYRKELISIENKLGKTLSELSLGESSSYTKTFTEKMLLHLLKLQGDNNLYI